MLRSIALALLIASSGVPLVSAQRAVDPLCPLMHMSLADALIKNGRPREVLGALESLGTVPSSPRGELPRGLAHRDLGTSEQAVDHLQQVLRLAPGSPLAEQALEILRQLQHSGSS